VDQVGIYNESLLPNDWNIVMEVMEIHGTVDLD